MTNKNKIGDKPIAPVLHDLMNNLARDVDIYLNGTKNIKMSKRENGFVLLVFPFNGHEGRANYISNSNREDIIILLKEQLARFEGQPETEGNA